MRIFVFLITIILYHATIHNAIRKISDFLDFFIYSNPDIVGVA